MKRLWIFCLMALVGLFLSCKDEPDTGDKDPYTEVFFKSYIGSYVVPNWQAFFYNDRGDDKPNISVRPNTVGWVEYVAPELTFGGSDGADYLKLAERNGDVSYNRYEVFQPDGGREACAENYKAIEIVCVDGDWDEAHPAGTSLNDLVEISFTSYADFIRSGYDASLETQMSRRKRMSDLTESDLSMLSPYLYFYFDHCPDKRYEVKITFTTTDGKEEIAACKI